VALPQLTPELRPQAPVARKLLPPPIKPKARLLMDAGGRAYAEPDGASAASSDGEVVTYDPKQGVNAPIVIVDDAPPAGSPTSVDWGGSPTDHEVETQAERLQVIFSQAPPAPPPKAGYLPGGGGTPTVPPMMVPPLGAPGQPMAQLNAMHPPWMSPPSQTKAGSPLGPQATPMKQAAESYSGHESECIGQPPKSAGRAASAAPAALDRHVSFDDLTGRSASS